MPIVQAHAARVAEHIRLRLADMPIEALAQPGSGLRLGPLRDAGVSRVGDVLRLGREGLLALDGVGEATAEPILQLARSEQEPTARDVVLPANPAQWLPSDRSLVSALLRFAPLAAFLGIPDISAAAELASYLRELWRATGWFRWIVAPTSKRQHLLDCGRAARRRYSQLERSGGLARLGQGSAGAALASHPRTDELATLWRVDAAHLGALLQQTLRGQAASPVRELLDQVGRPAGVPSDLVVRIASKQLHLETFKGVLRPYQEFGAKFLVVAERALLGDDMGLGKTAQALAAVSHVVSSHGGRALAVVPASLVDNWVREIDHFTHLQSWQYRGPMRADALRSWASGVGILVCSYELAADLVEQPLPTLAMVVVDEAHMSKNLDARRSRATRQLVAKAPFGALLTGTPIENRARDMLNLIGHLDRQLYDQLRRQFDDGDNAMNSPRAFRSAVASRYLRRNQTEVLDELPGIEAMDELITIGQVERDAYRREITGNQLARARRAAASANGRDSAKVKRLGNIAGDCRANGRKLLVFSYFLDVLAAVAEEIGDECTVLDGSVPVPARMATVDRFTATAGFSALALQITSMGQGVNLQAASVVVLMEPQLKPSTERQAVARAHRMGQTEMVLVYRLIAADTVEERLIEMLGRKEDIFENLAEISELAESTSDATDPGISESDLLRYEQRRLASSEH